jgi:hypothetical protein
VCRRPWSRGPRLLLVGSSWLNSRRVRAHVLYEIAIELLILDAGIQIKVERGCN